jgi:methionyl-tRNA formyltransferase
MKVLVIAEEAAGVQVLRALAGRGHEVVVAADPTRPDERAATVHRVATNLGFETLDCRRVVDPAFAKDIRDRSIGIALNVHSLHVIHPAVLAAVPLGCFNLHPGPLPQYAGLNTPSWAIYRGETSHGVTIHRMDAGIDTGPVVYLERYPIAGTDTGLVTSAHAVRIGVRLMLDLLDRVSDDPRALRLTPQDLTARRYFRRAAPDHGQLAWDRTARQVVDHVRAADYRPLRSPWGHPVARLGSADVGVVAAATTGLPSDASPGTIGDRLGDATLIACVDEWVAVRTLLVGGAYVPATDHLASRGRPPVAPTPA